MTKSNQSSLDIADHLSRGEYDWCPEAETRLKEQHDLIRQQHAEIDRLKYYLDGFKQNFFVSGFQLQIKMANEQLVKQQEQIDALKSELDRAVELYTDKSIENETLKKSHIELERGIVKDLNQRQMKNEPVAWMSIHEGVYSPSFEYLFSRTKKEGFIPLYTHPVKEQDESFDRTASHMAGEHVSYKPELTDEEILEYSDVFALDNSPLYEFTAKGLVLFARAILRKTQENG